MTAFLCRQTDMGDGLPGSVPRLTVGTPSWPACHKLRGTMITNLNMPMSPTAWWNHGPHTPPNDPVTPPTPTPVPEPWSFHLHQKHTHTGYLTWLTLGCPLFWNDPEEARHGKGCQLSSSDSLVSPFLSFPLFPAIRVCLHSMSHTTATVSVSSRRQHQGLQIHLRGQHPLTDICLFKRTQVWDIWLAPSQRQATLDLRMVHLSPLLCGEITKR